MILPLCLMALLGANPTTASQPQASNVHDLFFLVVGNSHYRELTATEKQSQRFVEFGNIPGSNTSARRVAQRLQAMGARDGRILVSKEGAYVTRQDVDAALDSLLKSIARIGARRPFIVFYFSGHGISEGVGWSHFSVPGSFAGPIDLTKLPELAEATVYAGDVFDRLKGSQHPFMMLLDSCYEGDPPVFPSNVLSKAAVENLRGLFAPLRFMNEFHEANPVLFSTAPGTLVPAVEDPSQASDKAIGPLARRLILLVDRALEAKRPLSLRGLISAMTDPMLDSKTSPAQTHAVLDTSEMWLMAATSRPGSRGEESIGTGKQPRIEDVAKSLAVAEEEQRPLYTAAPESFLSFTSEAGEYIGSGKSYKLPAKEAAFELQEQGQGEIVVLVTSNGSSWELDFAAPEGQKLATGTYTKAGRPSFQDPGRPGFSISGEGRGCNSVRSSFAVRTLAYDKKDRVIAFDADFSQQCDDSRKVLRGQLSYRARAP